LDADVDADERDSREGLVLFLETLCGRAFVRCVRGEERALYEALSIVHDEYGEAEAEVGIWEMGEVKVDEGG